MLESGSESAAANLTAEFRAGLKELGYIEGRNVLIEYRSAGAQYDRLPALAADLLDRKVALIIASGAVVSPLAARAATTTTPIVFFIGADPVQLGLIASLNKPGGNLTGVTIFGGEVLARKLQMIHQLVPKARALAALINPKNPSHPVNKSIWQRYGKALDVPIEVITASTEREFEPAIASLAEKQVDAVYVNPDSLFGNNLVAVLARHSMPAIFTVRQNVVAGALIAYGASLTEAKYQLGTYVGRVLKGEKPADLPVLQPTKFDLVINLKTAKALGIDVPQTLLIQATEIIE